MDRRDAIKQTMAWYGAALSTPLLLGVLNGCQPTGESGWTPTFLDADEAEVLDALSQLMFPTTDTPGARDVHLVECVDILLADCTSAEDKATFRSAIQMVRKQSSSSSKKPFSKRSAEDQIDVLKEIEDEVYSRKSANSDNYKSMKALLMAAFYTSEPVMKNMLNYSPLAGRFDACVDLDQDNRVFVDNNV